MADKDDKTTTETDAVVVNESASDLVVEGTVDNPPTTEQATVEKSESPFGEAASTTPPPTPNPPPALGGGSGGTSPAAADRQAADGGDDPFSERPELFVAGAFLGGIVLAKLIDALFGNDDD